MIMQKNFMGILKEVNLFCQKAIISMKHYILFLFFGVNLLTAQTLSSSLNKKSVDLGEPLVLKINIRNLQGKEVLTAPKNGLLPFHFEESKDEITQNTDEYSRVIEFSILDEGKFSIPALEFKVGDSIFRSIPYEIEVRNPAQQGEEISDIMPNQEVKLELMDYWELYQTHILGFLSVLGGILSLLFFKKRKKNQPKSIFSPNQSLQALAQLKSKKWIEKGEYRLFYVELLDISRGFLQNQFQIPAEILLTDDLIDFVKESQTLSIENIQMLEGVFTRGDLVKFAKTIPTTQQMEKDLESIENFIQSKK